MLRTHEIKMSFQRKTNPIALDLIKCLKNRSNNRDCFLLGHLSLSYRIIEVPWHRHNRHNTNGGACKHLFWFMGRQVLELVSLINQQSQSAAQIVQREEDRTRRLKNVCIFRINSKSFIKIKRDQWPRS